MTLDPARLAALFAAMAVLAAVPSLSVLTVASRAASAGFGHGALAALGVVIGDLIWIGIALFGLALLVEAAGDWAWTITAAGAVYLIVLGLQLWRSTQRDVNLDRSQHSPWASFLSGLLLTMGDQKAVLFYLGFLPAFVDLKKVTATDAAVIGLIALVTVGGVKLVYAALASRAGQVFGSRLGERLNLVAAAMMMLIGLWLIARLLFPATLAP